MKHLALILAISLSSCYTQHRATRQILKAQVHYPAIVADHCATIYPPKVDTFERISYKQGADVLHYDTIKIDCDSVIKQDIKIVRVPVVKERVRVDTVQKEVVRTVENTAATKAAQIKAYDLTLKNNELQDKITRLKTAKRYLWIACIVLAAIVFIPIFIKKILPIL